MSHPAKFKTLKTFNDPIYGFITIDDELIFQLVEHPFFQRLRRISQLGLTNLVYSGANHSRFQHALGAMNLMQNAISVLRAKGEEISAEDEQGAKIAILLHDSGHGPFSHALEATIVDGINHENISLQIMQALNQEFAGKLDKAIEIYKGTHPVKYLHQLVSGQLDVDRLDYLKRDSFFTGVSEGAIGSERLIKMMCVHEGNLAIEAKALYSLEKFLLARRLMYWQVYLHKAVLSAEFLLLNIFKKARDLVISGETLWTNETMQYFLEKDAPKISSSPSWLRQFVLLDDFDVMFHIKEWQQCPDPMLSSLCKRLISRDLLKVKQIDGPLSGQAIQKLKDQVTQKWNVQELDADYLLFQKTLHNTAYSAEQDTIRVLYKTGEVKDISEAANLFQFASMKSSEAKHFLYYPSGLNT